MAIEKNSDDIESQALRKNYKFEFLSICILFFLHPVMFLQDKSRAYFPPDAIQYMSFARDYLANGLLYVEFGSSNQGNILPIIYPALVLLADIFINDMMLSTEWVSSVAVLTTSIPFYLIFRRFADNFSSICAVLFIQLNYQLCLWAVTPLTEATFIFVLSWFIYFLTRIIEGEHGTALILALGICIAIAFLTRQIGLVLIPFALLALALAIPRQALKNYGLFSAGFLLLLLPYAVVLHAQTGLSVFNQAWSDREEITLDELPMEAQNQILSIYNNPTEDYQGLVIGRRALRELLGDNSAMLEEVKLETSAGNDNGLSSLLSLAWSEKNLYFERLGQNTKSLSGSLGTILSIFFCIAIVSSLAANEAKKIRLQRFILPGFVLYYLLALSLVSGLIDRYVLILLPFILFSIAREAYHLLHFLHDKIKNTFIIRAAFALLLIAFVFLQPLTVFDLKLQAKSSESIGPFAPFRPLITQGDPVMTLSPLYAYMINGAWRVMPNDSVEDIAQYAANEEIPWLLVVRGMSDADTEIGYYQNAIEWYHDQELILKHQEHMELVAHTNDGRIVLFRFLEKNLVIP